MKKIISTILLMVFCANISLAQQLPCVQSKTQTPLSQEDYKTMIKPYEKNNMKLIKKEEKSIAYKDNLRNSGLEIYKDALPYSDRGRVEVKLLDGDYAVWNSKYYDKDTIFGGAGKWKGRKKVQYAATYHKDNTLMGIVKMVRVDNNTFAFYDYRIKSPKIDLADLKHIMIYYNDEHKANFMYTVDGKLRSYQFDNKTYLIDMPEMPGVIEIDLSSLNNPNYLNDAAHLSGWAVAGTVTSAGAIAMIPVGLVVWPALMVLMIINSHE